MRHSTLLTEFTDISQRLEYLVAHSSQMIFVTGEDLAIQQGFVEAFLGQQSSHANVAFLTARRGKNAQYYRQELAEQLHIDEPRNKQTLAQQFASRADKKEPVIIAMTNAEHTPEEVLRELWDLVLQNRFTRNGEQINILMFGDQEWAEEVKSWLPTNNNDKPVLLTTQTLEYDEETEVEGDLDEMIANRRKLFKERMKSRAQSQGDSGSILQYWWVKLLLVGVFLVSFASILIWQYFDVTKNALQEFTQFIFQQSPVEEKNSIDTNELSAGLTLEEALVIEQGSNNRESAELVNADNGNQRVAENFTQAMNRLEALGTQNEASQKPVIDTSVNVQVNETADSPNSVTIAEITTEQLIQLRDAGTVSAEQTANEKPQTTLVNEPEVQTMTTNEELVIEELPTDPAAVELQESIFEAIMALEAMESGIPVEVSGAPQEIIQQESETLAGKNQTQVATQAQEEPLSQESVQNQLMVQVPANESSVVQSQQSATGNVEETAAQVTQTTQSNVQDYPVQDISANSGTVTSVPGYQFHEQLLLELPNDSYVLQLSGITTESLLEEYLVDNRMLNSVWVYKTQRYGGDWFVVLLNQSFDSLEAARSGVSLLSTELQAVEPFAKSVSQIKNEILSD